MIAPGSSASTLLGAHERPATALEARRPFGVRARFEVDEPLEDAAVEIGISTAEGWRIRDHLLPRVRRPVRDDRRHARGHGHVPRAGCFPGDYASTSACIASRRSLSIWSSTCSDSASARATTVDPLRSRDVGRDRRVRQWRGVLAPRAGGGHRPMTRLDTANATFWDELCGSALARQIGDHRRLARQLATLRRRLHGGFIPTCRATSSRCCAGKGGRSRSASDTAPSAACSRALVPTTTGWTSRSGPVEMVRGRLTQLGQPERVDQVVQGSALSIPWPDGHFDALVSIGCLHHTGQPRGLR